MLYRIARRRAIGAVAAEAFLPTSSLDSRDGHFRAPLARTLPAHQAGADGRLALLDIPLSTSARPSAISDRAYVGLPPIAGGQLENRFVGNWLFMAAAGLVEHGARRQSPGPARINAGDGAGGRAGAGDAAAAAAQCDPDRAGRK
jgi:hypothetical protein